MIERRHQPTADGRTLPEVQRDRLIELGKLGYRIFWLGDTTTIRTQIAIASIAFATILWTHPDTFDRPLFHGMRIAVEQWGRGLAVGGLNVWAFAFMLHGVGVFWRLWDRRAKPYWALAINCLGFFVWAMSTALINIAVGELTPSTALEMTVVAAAFVALVRTGLNDEPRTP